MDSKILEEIGLTAGEARVYLALLELGVSKSGKLSAKAGVSSSKVYKILDRLERKGFVGHVLKGKIKHFKALEPKLILNFLNEKEKQFEEKRKSFEEILPELEKRQKLQGEKTDATLLDGFKAVTNFFRNLIDELNAGETYYVIGATYGESEETLKDFFLKHHLRRNAKKIRVKMLANSDIRGNFTKTHYLNSEIRFLPQYLVSNMQITFYKNKILIAIFTKDPKGFLLESKEAVESFKSYFETLWKIAKP